MQVSIDHNSVVTQQGSVTRVSHGHPAPEQGTVDANASYMASTRVAGQVHRLVNGMEVQTSRVTRHQEGLPSQAGSSIMATLQRVGAHQSVELIPGNPGSRTSLQTAIRDGLVRPVGPGIFVDAEAAAPAQARQSQQVPAKGQEGAQEAAPFAWVDQNDMALWNEDVAAIPQHAYDSAVASVVALASGGNGSLDAVASRLAETQGMEPAVAQQYVTEGVAFYKDSLSRDLVKSVGLPKDQVEQFYHWAKGKPTLQKALSQLMHEGKSAEFRSMALAYKRESAGNAGGLAAFKAAGFETQVDRDTGDLLVRKPGKSWVKAKDL